MSTKKINAGDTLTVGDLTDDYLDAFIEVGNPEGIIYRLTLGSIDAGTAFTALVTKRGEDRQAFSRRDPVKVITPPPVVQPDEPTELGQCIRIEGDDWLGIVADPQYTRCPIRDTDGGWWYWDHVLSYAGDRRIIVSDPPRWPDETPVVPERIEAGEWPDDDTHLRAWEWHSVDDRFGNDHTARWNDQESQWECLLCDTAWGRGGQRKYAWTRGERVK